MWSGGLKDVERRSGGCEDVVFWRLRRDGLETAQRGSLDCSGEVV